MYSAGIVERYEKVGHWRQVQQRGRGCRRVEVGIADASGDGGERRENGVIGLDRGGG